MMFRTGFLQVSEWLRMAGLEDVILLFRDAGIDGAGLLQLRQLSTSDSSTFYATCESKLGINKFGLVKYVSPLTFICALAIVCHD